MILDLANEVWKQSDFFSTQYSGQSLSQREYFTYNMYIISSYTGGGGGVFITRKCFKNPHTFDHVKTYLQPMIKYISILSQSSMHTHKKILHTAIIDEFLAYWSVESVWCAFDTRVNYLQLRSIQHKVFSEGFTV